MIPDQQLRQLQPTNLDEARALSHWAAQLVTKAARANLEPVPDDSHSNLGWDSEAKSFVSQPIEGSGVQTHVTLSLDPMRLGVRRNGEVTTSLVLDELTDCEALEWLDTQLVTAGLEKASTIALPYELPDAVANVEAYHTSKLSAPLASLAAWFDTANHVLSRFASRLSDASPGASAVRCWPHHFDIATYVGLEQGPAETARGIGVGMSPGDESYDQPYFYVNPWPHLDPANLPPAPAPGHWHTEGFVGAIATGDEILKLSDIQSELPKFVAKAFDIGRDRLGDQG